MISLTIARELRLHRHIADASGRREIIWHSATLRCRLLPDGTAPRLARCTMLTSGPPYDDADWSNLLPRRHYQATSAYHFIEASP